MVESSLNWFLQNWFLKESGKIKNWDCSQLTAVLPANPARFWSLILASADFILTSNDVTKMAIHLKLFAFLEFFSTIFGGIYHKRCGAQTVGAAGMRGSTKNAVRRYYGVLNIYFRPKTSNYFISVAFFEKIPPVRVNK